MKHYFMHCFDIKVKVWRPFVFMALLGLSLTACVDNTDNPADPGQETTAGDEVKYSDFSAFYAPSVGEQIVNWYANKQQ